MTSIEPFRGWLLHDLERGEDGRCAAPPYDVIQGEERERYAALSPANIVHLTLPRAAGGLDGYGAARRLLEQMAEEGRLTRDEQPCFYLQDVRFRSPAGASLVRRGLIGLVAIEPIGKGAIRGHEKVQQKPLRDRRLLMEATLANLEPVIFLYRDPPGVIDRLLSGDRQRPPLSVAEFESLRFEFRRADAGVSAMIRSELSGRPLYLADGHHRFTVAHRFMEERPELPGSGYRMALLVRAEDPGLVVLPTHRFVRELPEAAARALTGRLERHFDLEPIESTGLLSRFERPIESGAFLVWLRREHRAWLATPRASAQDALSATPEPLRSLDVSLLHDFLLDPDALGQTLVCEYVRGEEDPIGRAVTEDVPLAFFLTAPRIETILRVSDQALYMPTKSTYFYPKAASGQVLFRLEEAL